MNGLVSDGEFIVGGHAELQNCPYDRPGANVRPPVVKERSVGAEEHPYQRYSATPSKVA